MPGIPKSKGCQTCKSRKIKCDETWPSCAQCAQIKVTCPGPTSLVKFINNGTYGSSRERKRHLIHSTIVPLGHYNSSLRSRKVRYANVDDDTAEYGLMKFSNPKVNPTTLSERVAARLVNNLERGPDGGISLQMSYLPLLPPRVAESTCLRDAVDLFCAAWADFRRRQPVGELMAMPQYGKALRSLRRALLNDQALKPETLATMLIFERCGRLFNRGQFSTMHIEGIMELAYRKGPPSLEDKLDVSIANEVNGYAIGDWTNRGDFVRQSPWKEVLDQCADTYDTQNFRPFDPKAISEFYERSKGLPDHIKAVQKILANPHDPEMMALATNLCQDLLEAEAVIREIAATSVENAINVGCIRILPDPESLVGHRYDFDYAMLCQIYLAMPTIRMMYLRIVYDLSALYDMPNLSVYADYRATCEETWMAVPYVCSLESIVASNMMSPLYLSYEAADEREREYLLGIFTYLDRYLERNPKGKSKLDWAVLETAKLLTGRRT